MKKLFASAALAASFFSPVMASAMSVLDADVLPGVSVTDRLIDGRLKGRVIELYTNGQTKEVNKTWRKTHAQALARHCMFTKDARGESDTAHMCDVIYSY